MSGRAARASRRSTPIALALALSLLAACGGGGTTGPATGGGSSAAPAAPGWEAFVNSLKNKYSGKTLRIITISDPFVPAMNKTTDEFTKLTGAKVVTDAFGYDAVYQKEQLACQQGSSAYDVIVFDVPWTQAFVNCTDHLNPLIAKADKDVIGYDDYFPVMRQAVEWKGEVIGLPFAPYFVLHHYNTKYFDTLGLKPPGNFSELVANAKAANQNPKMPNVYATITNNQAGSAVGQAFFEYIYNFEGGKPFESMYPGTKDAYADMTPLFSSPQGIATVELFKSLLPYQPPGALNYAWQERQSYFNTGKVAFVSQWNVTTPSASDPKQSTVVNSHATAPFPHDSTKLVTQVGGWSLSINKAGKQKDLSWDFMQWFSGGPTNVAFAKAGGFPSRTSTLNNADLNKQYPWYATLKEVIPTAFADCRPRNNESFNIINTLGTQISKALSGQATTEAAMKAADQQIGKMLKDAGYKVNLR
ncbi:MAG: extracellular solute-binding protein [Chloroflexota bacterium]|nr:extracellular solute-binding protein [Chloroflexota bacterium]